jgi:transcriptional regulator of acetoin/glycerol metabolism
MPAARLGKPETSGASERRRIMTELRRHNGNRSLAARSLGMDRSTLWRKLKKYQLTER